MLMLQSPGWGVGAGLYESGLAALEAWFTVVYHSPAGSDTSTEPADPADMNVATFVADLERLRSHLGLDSVALLGHSHGGYIAMNYALRYQQHLSHLILVDAQLGVTEPGDDLRESLPRLAADPRFAAAAQAFMAPRKLDTDKDLSTLLEAIFPLYFHDPDAPAVAAARAYVREHRISAAAMNASSAADGRFAVRDRLREIQVPTLAIAGRQDFICSPVQARVIAENVPGAELLIIEDCGHLPWAEQPETFFAAVRDFAGQMPGSDPAGS